MTYADVFRPAERQRGLIYDLGLVLAASLLIAVSAQVSFYFPFSPVPVSGQTFGVLLVGALLGSKRGFSAVVVYLAEGAMGLPVFAGGAAGAAVLAGPTGGYLVGFAVAAYLVGWLAERGWDRRFVMTILMMVLGNLVIYALGVTRLAMILGDFGTAITAGLVPFIVGDLLKIALATALLPTGWRFLNKVDESEANEP
jgi:biotin transport system substrate-specific component